MGAEAYNCLLQSVLTKKLPSDLCLIIRRKVTEDNWDLDNIIKELEQSLNAREHMRVTRQKPSEEKQRK